MDSKNNISRTFKKEVKTMKPKKKKNLPLTDKQKALLVDAPQNAFKVLFPNHTRAFLIVEKAKLIDSLPVEKQIENEIIFNETKKQGKLAQEKNKFLIGEVKRLTKEIEAMAALKKNLQTYKIEATTGTGESEATAIALLSDWHVDEVVRASSVNFLNRFDFALAEKRVNETFRVIARMIDIHQRDITINTLVLALLGDFISGSIHDDLKENNSMLPIDATWKVQNMLLSGINFLLENTNVNLIIPCCPGNHSRITEKQRVSTEHGNSLETLIYRNLALHFENEPRVKFLIPDSYHVYVDVYSYTLRFHHGHDIKYQGGIGGIFIPAYKAISQWDKARKADCDFFGHFHNMKDGGNFICNGSLVGFNQYAIKIKADFEKPKQAFVLFDKKRGKTVVAPIVLNGE